jgi:hypothetical protein
MPRTRTDKSKAVSHVQALSTGFIAGNVQYYSDSQNREGILKDVRAADESRAVEEDLPPFSKNLVKFCSVTRRRSAICPSCEISETKYYCDIRAEGEGKAS